MAVKNFALRPDSGIMQFCTLKTLSFNLIYVAACYPVGTGMCHNMVGLLQHYKLRDAKWVWDSVFVISCTFQHVTNSQ